jgi:hypothetical protein
MQRTVQVRQTLYGNLLNIHPHTLHGNCPTLVISHDPLLRISVAGPRTGLLAATLAPGSTEV